MRRKSRGSVQMTTKLKPLEPQPPEDARLELIEHGQARFIYTPPDGVKQLGRDRLYCDIPAEIRNKRGLIVSKHEGLWQWLWQEPQVEDTA